MLEVIKSPSLLVAARNPIEYIVETDAYQISAGGYAYADIDFVDIPADGDSFTLSFLGKIFPFSFNTAPDDSGTELPSYPAGEPFVDDHAKDFFIPWLESIVEITQNYQVLFISGSVSTATVRIIAREPGTKYNITNPALSSIAFSFATIYDGVDPSYEKSFRILCDVFAEKTVGANDYEPIYNSDGVVDPLFQCTFDLSKVITGILSYDIPTFSGDIFFNLLAQFRRYFVRFAEFYGDPPKARRYYQVPSLGGSSGRNIYVTAILGAEKFIKAEKETFYDDYVDAAPQKFLTSMPRNCILHKDQHQYLSFFLDNPVGESLKLKVQVKLYYDDNTTGAFTSAADITNTTNGQRVVSIRCGYNALNIAALITVGKTLVGYDVRVVKTDANVVVTETIHFTIEPDYHRNARFFLFINSLGCPEVISFYGDLQRDMQFDNDSFRTPVVNNASDSTVIKGQFQEVNNQVRFLYKLNTGNRPKEYQSYFMDFIASRNRFIQQTDKYTQLNLDKQKVSLENDNDTVFSVAFSYSDGWIEEGLA